MNNKILLLLGLTLFFLVMSVFYIFLTVDNQVEKELQPIMPFIVLSGFFIFLIAAFLIAFSFTRVIK